MDIHALKRQGMTISEIARRTNHDRKTIRAYLNGERQPGMRERTIPDSFDAFVWAAPVVRSAQYVSRFLLTCGCMIERTRPGNGNRARNAGAHGCTRVSSH